MSTNHRKKTFVDAEVQGALVRRILLHWLAFFVVAAGCTIVLQLCLDPFRSFGQMVREAWWSHGPFLLILGVLLPVFVVDTIKLSNRFVGPIRRLQQAITEAAESGHVKPIRLRRGDFWQGLAANFNTLVDRVNQGAEDGAQLAEESRELQEVS